MNEQEFERAIDGLTLAMTTGFNGLNARLDSVNSHLAKVNGRLDRHDRDILELQLDRARQEGREEREDDDRPLLTTRDGRLIKLLWGVGVALVAAVGWIIAHWPKA